MGAIFGYKGFEDRNLIRKMSRKLKHRALDGFRYYKNKNVTFGQGIIKIGKDFCPFPITNEEGNVVLICDGRIFRSDKIKQSLESKGHRFKTIFSGEVILHLYEEYGMKFLNQINGDFGFCIYDSNKTHLILCSDSSGSKPIYYCHKDKELIFASDIKPILQYELVKKKLDKYALDLFLTYLLLPTEKTLFESIKKVVPSTYIIFKENSKRIVKYCEIGEDIKNNKSEQYFIKKTREKLESAIEDRIVDDVPVHVALGGLDSGSVTGILSSKTSNINTYSLTFAGGKSSLKLARKIAEMNNTNHHEIYLDQESINKFYKEKLPYFNWPSVMYMDTITNSNIFFRIKGKKHLYFNGEGGDSVFGGINNEQMLIDKKFINAPHNIKKIVSFLINSSNKGIYILNDLLLAINYNAQFTQLRNITPSRKSQSVDEIYAALTDTFYFQYYTTRNGMKVNPKLLFIYNRYLRNHKFCFVNRLMKMNIEVESYMEQIARDEILCSSQGLVNNCPFLDKELIRFSFQVPIKYKFKRYFNKVLLAKATKDLFIKNINLKKTDLGIDSWVFYKSYLRENKSIIKNLFDNSNIFDCFKKKFLDSTLKSLDATQNNIWEEKKDIRRIHTLFSLGLWYEHYFNDEKISRYL